MCLTFKKNNKQTKKPVNRFLQDDASAGLRSLQTSIEIKLCQNPSDRLYFCFCKSVLRNSIMPHCALDCCRFFGTPCILYYTLYSLKETLRDQCTPTQKVMLLLFIINPLIQENTNNVVKGISNEAFCLFKIGFD